MTRHATYGPMMLGKRGALLLAAMAASLAMCFAGPAPASADTAHNFCSNVYLSPYGKSGDRCLATYGNYLFATTLVTHERAGCINSTVNGNLAQAWTCGAANSSPAVVLWFYGTDQWIVRQPIIRNNNSTYSAHFDGHYSCMQECG